MLDFKLYMRTAAYPRMRREYRWERWLRICHFLIMFPRAKRAERASLSESEV